MLTVNDEFRRVQSNIVQKLEGTHGITGSKLHGYVDVLFGTMT